MDATYDAINVNENLNLWKAYNQLDDRLLMVACKDREAVDGERWVVTALSNEEAKE